jgi:chemotaxis protein CheD
MVGMGQIMVAENDGQLYSILGSCVAVTMHHPRLHVAAMCHIVLAESKSETALPGKYADTAIPEMLRLLAQYDAKPSGLTIKIAGGASMFSGGGPLKMGVANVDAVVALLDANRLPIENRHTGGEKGRRVTFDCRTGELLVDIIGHDTIIL